MSEEKGSGAKELSSEFIDEVSTMLEKLKDKLGKCEGQSNTPSLNFDSCEDFPPKNEAEVLNLISKLQNTLDNITKSDESPIILSEEGSLNNVESKMDSCESRCETPVVLSEDYEANSEDSPDEDYRRQRTSSKETALRKLYTEPQKRTRELSSSGSQNVASEEKKCDQKPCILNRRRHSKESERSPLDITNCQSLEERVEQTLNSGVGFSPYVINSPSDDEEAQFTLNKKKRELPWKIRAAKKRLEYSKSENAIYKVNREKYGLSNSTETIYTIQQPVKTESYIHSKSTGNINNLPVLSGSCLPVSQIERNVLSKNDKYQDKCSEVLPISDNLPASSDESDSSDDEGEVFTMKSITENFLSLQEQQEHKEKSRLPFDVNTKEVMKITEKFSKPIDNPAQKTLEKAPRKKVYGPIKNNVSVSKQAKPTTLKTPKLTLIQDISSPKPDVPQIISSPTSTLPPNVISPTFDTPENTLSPTLDIYQNILSPKFDVPQSILSPTCDVPQNVLSQKFDVNQRILSPKSDVPIIRAFPIIGKSMSNSTTEENDNEISHSTNSPVNSKAIVNNIFLSNSKSYENGRNNKIPSGETMGYKLTKSKSSPVCLKLANRSGKVTWNVNETASNFQNTSLKPCFTNKTEKVKTNMVSNIQSKFEFQHPSVTSQSNTKEIATKIQQQNIDFSQMKDICDDPSILLFTPEQLLKIAIHKAAINKQLTVDIDDRKIVRTVSDSGSVQNKHPPLQQTFSLDSDNLATTISLSEIFAVSEYKDRLDFCEEIASDAKKKVYLNKINTCENSTTDEKSNKLTQKEIKRRAFSDSDECDGHGIFHPKKDNTVIFGASREIFQLTDGNQYNLPMPYEKSDVTTAISNSLESPVSQLPNIASYVTSEMPLETGGKYEEISKQNKKSFLSHDMATSTHTGDKDNKNITRPILKCQKNEHSIEDAAQLLNITVIHRKLKEEEVKKRSCSVTNSGESSSLLTNGFDSLKLCSENEFHNQNIFQPKVEQIHCEDTHTNNQESCQIPKTCGKELTHQPKNIKKTRRSRSKSLFTMNTETNEERSHENESAQNFDDMRPSDHGNAKKTMLENNFILEKCYGNLTELKGQFNKSSFIEINKAAINNDSHETVSIFKQNGATKQPISSSILSSPEIIDQKKGKLRYTDFIVPPLPTSAHKISQLESCPSALSPTPSVTNSTGACSDKDFRDSQESDKLNKVSDTWISATKNPNIITSSKPWAKENNNTIRGLFVKKNKEKLLQAKDSSMKPLDNTINTNVRSGKNIIDSKNNLEQYNIAETKLLKNYSNIALEPKNLTNRVKNISSKFKTIIGSTKSTLKCKQIDKTNYGTELADLKMRLHKKDEYSINSSTDCQNLIDTKSHKNYRKNIITNKSDCIANNNKKINIISIPINDIHDTNKKHTTEKIKRLPEKNKKEKSHVNSASIKDVKTVAAAGAKDSYVVDNNSGPTINKLSKTSDAFKNISKQIDDDKSNNINCTLPKHSDKRVSCTLKQFSKWDNNIKETEDAPSNSLWKSSSTSQSIVKKNKNKLENKDCLLDSKPCEKISASTEEFKSALFNFEQNQTEATETNYAEKRNSHIPINNTGIIKKQLAQFGEQGDSKSVNYPIRLSKSCTFRHSSFEPFINDTPPIEDISVIKRQKPKDSHSVKFSQIVESLECGKPNPTIDLSSSIKQKPNRSRPKSLYSSDTDKKSFIINQFSWNKEVGKLPLSSIKSESKSIAEDKRKQLELYLQNSQSILGKAHTSKQYNSRIKSNSNKTRIKSNSSSERSSICESWEHLVSNTDYNSQLLDELFSETILKDIELSDSSLSRRRFSDFSVDSNDGISEVCVGSKIVRSQTLGHMLHRDSGRSVITVDNDANSCDKVYGSIVKESSKVRCLGDHDKARMTLLKLATFESNPRSGKSVNAYEGLVNQSSYVGMSYNNNINNLSTKMESTINKYNSNSDQETPDINSKSEYTFSDSESIVSECEVCGVNASNPCDPLLYEGELSSTHCSDEDISVPVINVTDLEPGLKIFSPNICPTQNPFENYHHRLTVQKQSLLLDRPKPSDLKHSELMKNYFTCVKHADINF